MSQPAETKTLDARIPADALEGLARFAGEQPLKLMESRFREACIETLSRLVAEHEKAKSATAIIGDPPGATNG